MKTDTIIKTSAPATPVPILIEITEEDRRNAGKFMDTHNCLICTALKRMGYNDLNVGVQFASVNGVSYTMEEQGCSQLKAKVQLLFPELKPHYRRGVVGRQIILYPQ